MFISPINLNSINILKKKQDNFYNTKYPNLSPLPNDVVSFSGRAKLISSNMQDSPSESDCRKVSENAEPARFYLENVIQKYVGHLVTPSVDESSEQYPVAKCSTRIKRPSSIREKVVSKYSKKYREEVNQFTNQVFDELSQYFKFSEEADRETVLNEIKSVINGDGRQRTMSPYEYSAFYLSEIVEALEKYERFDFDSYSPSRLKSIFSEIVESLEATIDSDNINDTVYLDPTGVAGIKHYANDIVGGRILLDESSPEYTGLIIDALKQAVSDGVLNITSIENNVPDPDKLPEGKQVSEYIYATDAQLRSLAKAAGAKLIKNKSKTGYLAVHINVDLSNKAFERFGGIFNGYKGEIQIIGTDVEKLKEVEDLCYKLKDNKNAIHVAYKPFKDHFQKYYNESTQDAFDDYTYALYLAQRAIKPGTRRNQVFPTISDLGFEGKVPPELDFNVLRKLKHSCDKELLRIEDEQAKKSAAKKKTSFRKQDEINRVKSLSTYYLK